MSRDRYFDEHDQPPSCCDEAYEAGLREREKCIAELEAEVKQLKEQLEPVRVVAPLQVKHRTYEPWEVS